MRACVHACVRTCVYSCNHHEDKILFIKQIEIIEINRFREMSHRLGNSWKSAGRGEGGWREKKKIPSDGGMKSTCHMFSISWQYLQTVRVIVVSFFTHFLQPYLIQARRYDKQILMEA